MSLYWLEALMLFLREERYSDFAMFLTVGLVAASIGFLFALWIESRSNRIGRSWVRFTISSAALSVISLIVVTFILTSIVTLT
jgi:uncharacterized membrane protein